MSSITPPSLVGHQAVLDLARREPGDVVGRDALEPGERVGPVEREPAHVADVEQPDALADGLVLLDDRRVLDGHRPAAELDEPAAVGLVPGVQRGLQERLAGHRAVPWRPRERSFGSATIVASRGPARQLSLDRGPSGDHLLATFRQNLTGRLCHPTQGIRDQEQLTTRDSSHVPDDVGILDRGGARTIWPYSRDIVPILISLRPIVGDRVSGDHFPEHFRVRHSFHGDPTQNLVLVVRQSVAEIR